MNPFLTRVAAAFLWLAVLVAASLRAEISSAKDAPLSKRLTDPSPTVRKQAALVLAETNDANAIPILIDLLAELPRKERQSVEDFLTQLAGEWAPVLPFATDDDLSRGVRRDAWASWWRRADGPWLLAALGKHTLTTDQRRKIEELLTQLGSADFTVREDASRQLRSFGRLALPRLREASKDRDAEVARRAKLLCERAKNDPDLRLSLAVPRLLALRKPAGAVEALLSYVPFVEDEDREDEVRKALTLLARRDGKLDPLLLRSVADSQPKVRALAAEALIQGGGEEGRAAARKRLADDVPSVRLSVALALARASERQSVPVLIELVPLLPAEESAEAEDALYQLAGDTAPCTPTDAESDDKKKRRDAWRSWWKVHAEHTDLTALTARRLLGGTLICDYRTIAALDRRGRKCWSIDNVESPRDIQVLPGGRVLIAEWSAHRVSERDQKGRVLWEKAGLSDGPVNARRLPNGNTFIALIGGAILEVDRAGKEIYKIDNIPRVLAAYRTRRGAIVCLTGNNRCLLLDTTGKQLQSFAVKYPIYTGGCLDVLPDGRIFIASTASGKVMEYDSQGKLLHEWNAPHVTTATGLPNGHILACSQSVNRVIELDRAGKIVWEQKTFSPCRARRH